MRCRGLALFRRNHCNARCYTLQRCNTLASRESLSSRGVALFCREKHSKTPYTCTNIHIYNIYIYVYVYIHICIYIWMIHVQEGEVLKLLLKSVILQEGSHWRIRMCHVTHSRMWHDSLKCVTSLIYMWHVTHPHALNGSFTCVTAHVWHFHVAIFTQTFKPYTSTRKRKSRRNDMSCCHFKTPCVFKEVWV